MNVFFTSDTHFSHARIIELCNRPFGNVDDMNNVLIDNWNSVVRDGDLVWHLGDFSFDKNPDNNARFFHALRGEKYLIAGNHDHSATKSLPWAAVYDYCRWNYHKNSYVMFHYPMEDWDSRYRGSFHLHGHVHATPTKRTIAQIANRFDVGVDNNMYTPVSLEDIISS